MALRVRLSEDAADALRVLPPKAKRAIRAALGALSEDLTGQDDRWDVA